MDKLLEVHNLTVSYHRKPVLWDIDFDLPKEQIIGIIGPNGSGKTTLLKSIMGLIKSDSGFVKIFGKKIDEVRSRIAYIPQKESVDWDFPITVKEVVEMGRFNPKNIFYRQSKEDKKIVLEALKTVNMLDFSDRQISELSGGQQQRVFIARAIAQKADLYIMDEPFVGVDIATEEAILKLMEQMKNDGKTVIVVHHDLQTVAKYFDWLVLLNTRMVSNGPIEEVMTSSNIKEAFGGQLTILAELQNLIKQKEFPVREKGFEDREDE